MIEIQAVTQRFGNVEAVRNVDLSIRKGEIFGIIGRSGAGKSTLVRTLNLLNRPTSGRIVLDGQDLTSLSSSQLREARRGIGMIFQHFNLLSSRSVYDNIALPLELAGKSKSEIAAKVEPLLELVGLTALLVGGVGVGNAVRDFLSGKMHTIATLKCIGASTGLIFTAYLVQVMCMALMGVAIGLIVGAVIPAAIADLLRDALPVVSQIGLYWEPLLLAGAFGILTALAFSVWPIARACDLPAASLFRDSIARFRILDHLPFALATIILLAGLGVLAVETAHSRLIAMWFVGGAAAAALQVCNFGEAWRVCTAGCVAYGPGCCFR